MGIISCVITSTAHTWCYWNSFRQAAGGFLVGSINSFRIIAYSMTLAMNTFNIDMNQLDLRARYLLFRFWSILSRFYSIKHWIKLSCGLKHKFQMEEYKFNTFKIEHTMALCGRQHKTIIKSIYFWYEQINLSQEKGQSINYFMKCKNKWLAKSSLKHHTFWGIHWVHFAASHLRLSRITAWTYFYLICTTLRKDFIYYHANSLLESFYWALCLEKALKLQTLLTSPLRRSFGCLFLSKIGVEVRFLSQCLFKFRILQRLSSATFFHEIVEMMWQLFEKSRSRKLQKHVDAVH